MHFEIQYLGNWQRIGTGETVQELRPHLVPLTQEARNLLEDEVNYQHDSLFDPFFVGGYSYLPNLKTWAFRFKGSDNLDKALEIAEKTCRG